MSTNSLPASGWLPDPEQPGTLRLRCNGAWTDKVLTTQQPWGPSRLLPPVTHVPVLACA